MTRQRKKEVLGLILMVLALLVTLSLVTYDAADDPIARTFSLDAALNPGNNRAVNALGLVGAVIAWMLVPNFLGYATVLLSALVFAWGYVVFRNRTPVFLPFVSVLTAVGAFVLACLFGWLGIVAGANLALWSGAVGLGTAGWMQHVFGTVGSLILLLLLIAVTLLLWIDRDIQKTMDRVEDAFLSIRARFTTGVDDFRERRLERRAERARLLEERRQERERHDRERQERLRQERERQERERATSARPAARTEPQEPVRPATSLPPVPPKSIPPLPRTDVVPSAGDASRRDETDDGPSLNDLFRTPPTPATAPAARAGRDELPALELKVRERVEEERAESVEREADVPDEEIDRQFQFPPIDLLDAAEGGGAHIDYAELEENKRVLLDKLFTYNIEITEINAIVGPTVTLYELTPAPGVKISRITALEDDLAMAMAARGIRMIAPIPGKSAVGVEIPNRHRELVPIRDVIATAKFRDAKMELPVPIGKSIEGEVFMHDLTKMPHLLIAGATGSGKSVGLNTLITGLLYACHPANLKFVMIDPKKIELQQYTQMVDHYLAMPADGVDPIITDFTEALGVLKSCEKEMEKRYDILAKASVRGIKDYNRKLQEGKLSPQDGHRHLPYIVVIVDELADLMMTAGKEIEGPIARLAQMARAVGIHLVLATQRPSVDVITGLIKANFPARIAYQVASKIDSRTILDQNGAEGLVGNGDLLYMMGSRLIRLQGPFVGIEEIDRVMAFIAAQPGHGPYLLPPSGVRDEPDEEFVTEEMDDLFEEAARIIVRSQQGSVSLLQRKLSVGYARAARIVDQLEDAGIVGPFVGSKAREVLIQSEVQLDEMLRTYKESQA